MEVLLTNGFFSPMTSVIVFGVMYCAYYVEKNYLTQPMTAKSNNTNKTKVNTTAPVLTTNPVMEPVGVLEEV